MSGKVTGLIFAFLTIVFVASAAFAQTPDASLKPSVVSGDVTEIAAGKIVVQTKDGPLNIAISDKTEFKRVPAETPSLKAAVASALTEIGVGDKLVVSGIFGADKSTLPARTVYLMSKSDIAQKQAKDSEEWRRGIAGRVKAVDELAGKIVVEQRGLTGTTTITVTPKEKIKYLRYAPDSVQFSEAKESTISELKPGDMMRAIGDKGPDGTTFAADEIISGAFQTRAGKVKSVDTAKNQIVVTDLQTDKDLTIAVIPTSVLKQFPQEMATRMAAFQSGGQGGFRPAGQGAGNRPANPGGQAPSGQGRPGFGGGARSGGIDDMLDRFPTITAADLKVGDIIAVSSTRNSDLDHITAIKLVSGVEPFLRAAQTGAGGRQGGGRQLDLNIPGLDSFGTP